MAPLIFHYAITPAETKNKTTITHTGKEARRKKICWSAALIIYLLFNKTNNRPRELLWYLYCFSSYYLVVDVFRFWFCGRAEKPEIDCLQMHLQSKALVHMRDLLCVPCFAPFSVAERTNEAKYNVSASSYFFSHLLFVVLRW